MKVLFISTPNDGSCGIGTYTGELSESMSIDTGHSYIDQSNVLRSLVKITLHLLFKKYDVIHVQHEYQLFGPNSVYSLIFLPIYRVISLVRGKPLFITLHSVWDSNKTTTKIANSFIGSTYIRLMNNIFKYSTSCIIFVSKTSKRRFTASITAGADSIRVIGHGVPDTNVSISQKEAKEVFGYDENQTLIVEPGYIAKYKGTDLLVEVANNLPEYSFLIAGGSRVQSEYAESLKKDTPTNVSITGILTNERFEMSFIAADLIVLPYRGVNQSGILNWSAAYVCPVIASDLEYFKQELYDQWECIELFKSGCIESLEVMIIDLIMDEMKRNKLKDNMRAYKNNHNFESACDNHVDIYSNKLNA